jgi:hypothetical protein
MFVCILVPRFHFPTSRKLKVWLEPTTQCQRLHGSFGKKKPKKNIYKKVGFDQKFILYTLVWLFLISSSQKIWKEAEVSEYYLISDIFKIYVLNKLGIVGNGNF